MPKLAYCVIIKALPGKRDEVKKLWEESIKPHVAANDELEFSCYSYSIQDSDTICLFEIMTEGKVLKTAMKTDWFKNYLEALEPLLAGPPQVIPAIPVWTKGTEL